MASTTKQMKQDTTRTREDKQGARAKNEDQSKGTSGVEVLAQERKSYLQKEYKILTDLMNTYMGRVESLLQENKFLEKEGKRNQKESNTYLSYATKRSQKCQNLVITLNDQNHVDLSKVQKEKEKLVSQCAAKEEELRRALKEVQTKLSLMNKEVEDLQRLFGPSIQLERMKRIKELEKELLVTKVECAEQMHKIRSEFLRAKADCERDFHRKIQAVTERAEAAAAQCAIEQIKETRAENWHLRQELLRLIQHSKVLKDTKVQLEEQQQQLLRENKYILNTAPTRHWLPLQEAHSADSKPSSSHRLGHIH
ncbi:coiled-coil domain-containing protein 166-like [Phaenicophaeus curvirostris]|uniref:coiled-coil domain-containing protein 166-like n=1 Tax=Phaenicophaeus curvirostris TaxID=33595 RepID=UPI0037F0AE88